MPHENLKAYSEVYRYFLALDELRRKISWNGELTLCHVMMRGRRAERLKCSDSFLSILSIKCRNWFYWADRAEAAERAESKESPVFMQI